MFTSLDFDHPPTETARACSATAQLIYVLLIPDEIDCPADARQGSLRVIAARRAHPRVPVSAAAAAAVRKHLGYNSPPPVFIGVVPAGQGEQRAAVFATRVSSQPLAAQP
jgi:hypothetical protein